MNEPQFITGTWLPMRCCPKPYTALLWLEASAAVCKEDSTSDALGQTNTYGTQALSSGCTAFEALQD